MSSYCRTVLMCLLLDIRPSPSGDGKELFAIEGVHHVRQSIGQPEFDGVGGPGNRVCHPGFFIRLEPGLHVVSQIPPVVTAVYADAQPRILGRAKVLRHRAQAVVATFRPASPPP